MVAGVRKSLLYNNFPQPLQPLRVFMRVVGQACWNVAAWFGEYLQIALCATQSVQMLKVLYVCEYGTLNGGERSLLAWLPHVATGGVEPTVLAPGKGLFTEAVQHAGIALAYWPLQSPQTHERRRAVLRKIIERLSPDIVHANSLSMSRLVGPVAAELGVSSIGHLRDIVRVSRRAMGDINANRRVLAVSEATRQWHVAQGLDANRAGVLYNGVDLTEFRPRAASGYLHRELQLPKAARLVTTIGQLGMRKGMDVFLNAAEQVAAELPDLHYLIVGERYSGKEEAIEFERALHRQADARALGGRVHFLGYRQDIPNLLHETELLVHAARQEPLGRVLLEAAASGTAIVATDVGGTREILGPQAALIPAQDAQALAAAMSAMLHDDRQRKTVAAAAHCRAVELFDIRRSAARLLEIYANL